MFKFIAMVLAAANLWAADAPPATPKHPVTDDYHGAKVVDDYRRYVQSGNRITGAGISSGLDLAMYIVSLLYGVGVARQGQLAMQYNPQPAFHCGDPGDSDIRDDPGMVASRMDDWHVAEARKAVAHWLSK